MRARFEAAAEEVISIGWQTARFSRTKRLQQLREYLKTEKTTDPEMGALDLRAMIARMAERQKQPRDGEEGET